MARASTYKAAGVDIDLKERLIPMFRRDRALTRRAPGAGRNRRLRRADRTRRRLSRMRSPVLVAGTDGVGTKLKIAFATGRHDTRRDRLRRDVRQRHHLPRRRPLFFLDYIGTGKLDARVASRNGRGYRARMRARPAISLVGGETAQMPGIYRRGEYDSGGIRGRAWPSAREIPSPAAVRAGDVLVGLASSGLHSNGYLAGAQGPARTRAAAARAVSTSSAARSPTRCCVRRGSMRQMARRLFAASH